LPSYNRVLCAINAAAPFLVPTQATNLALLVSAILKKRSLCLSELARAYPTPEERAGWLLPRARPPAPPKEALALHRQRTDRCSWGAAGPGASHHSLPGFSPLIRVLAIDWT
jgi:hypothetical protein